MVASRNRKHTSLKMNIRGGAYTDIRELIRLRHASRGLELPISNRALNPLSGLLASKIRGRGVDFAEVRAYQPGDDVRTIDWRVTARTQIAHTKVFQEEKERPVLILVDQSRSMFFGSRVSFKSVVAAETAAVLAWTALDRGDRVGGIVFSDDNHREVRPRRNKHSVLRLLNEVNDFNQRLNIHNISSTTESNDYLTNAIRNVRRVAKHGSAIFIISDFIDFSSEAQLHLGQLSRHNDIVGIHVSDTLEQDLPRPNLYTITNGRDRARINTASKHYRDAYRQEYTNHLAIIRTEFIKQKSPLIELRTEHMADDGIINALSVAARKVEIK